MNKDTPQKMYTVHELATLAGVSARTLHYYDEIGLLPPAAVAVNGYRQYGPAEVRALQAIMLYRRFGIPLKEIRPLLDASPSQQAAALQEQLSRLRAERAALDALADNLQHTILELKGDYTMNDTERFAALKQSMIDKNEKQYGTEVRATYGDKTADAANARVKGMSEADWQEVQALNAEMAALLPQCVAAPEDAVLAQRLADAHRRWLCHYWPAGMYTPEAHLGMAALYRADERFAAYYNAITPGGCDAICRAIEFSCKK